MNSVISGTGYILVHTPDMVLHNGTTQTTEQTVNPDSPYLKALPDHLRTYEQALHYWPNQVYIGNKHPEELARIPQPWFSRDCDCSDRYGPFGQIMPQEEFFLLLQACDVFSLVKLEQSFADRTRQALAENPALTPEILGRIPADQTDQAEILRLVECEHAEGLYHHGRLVGCVTRAHDLDPNLSAHVMLENLASKASSVLAIRSALHHAGISADQVEYVIDCSEEACGDMNQRGGGNFAKSAAEIAGLTHATGSDVRGFCAAPAHAIVNAAALVSAGACRTVLVTAGGCTAKLGMNGKDHVKKELPILEDMLGGFAVVISQNDGVNPEINLELLGRHTVGTGSAPQAVISSLVTEPLERAGLGIPDIDKYAPELQNPEITKPAGAGDVPLANYKMIAALAVRRGELERSALLDFTAAHGLTGWAPTQGHIPSGVPYLGFARQDLLRGAIRRVMIIGKGSLFLGRMTNLFDGISFVVQANSGSKPQALPQAQEVRRQLAEALRDLAAGLLARETE